jgi:AraC-like DNA-binding protein
MTAVCQNSAGRSWKKNIRRPQAVSSASGQARARAASSRVPDWGRRFDIVERALIDRLAEPTLHTSVVEWSLRRIQARGGDQNVRELSRELGYSQKQVGRIFREWVGVSPKMHARIVRFDRLTRLLRAPTDRSWAELAAHLGFCDQSNLHRDVRHFAGCSPP